MSLRPRASVCILQSVLLDRGQQGHMVTLPSEKSLARGLGLLALILRDGLEKDVFHGEARDDVDHLGQTVHCRSRRSEQDSTQGRRQGKSRHLRSEITDGPSLIQRAERIQLQQCLLQRIARRRAEKGKRHDVFDPSGLDHEDGLREIAAEDLRHRGFVELLMVLFGV